MVDRRCKLRERYSESEANAILSELFDFYLEYIQNHTYFKLSHIARKFLNETEKSEEYFRSFICFLRNFNCRLEELNAVEKYTNSPRRTFKSDIDMLNKLVS